MTQPKVIASSQTHTPEQMADVLVRRRSEHFTATRQELLQLMVHHGALQFDGPYTLASGKLSDYYVDCRVLTLNSETLPKIAYWIKERMWDFLMGDPALIVGIPVGADPLIGALLDGYGRANIRVYGALVRKEAKGHGVGERIVGELIGNEAMVIEDVVTTAGSFGMEDRQRGMWRPGSLLDAIQVLREADVDVPAVFCIVDRQEGGGEALAAQGVQLHSLITAEDILKYKAELGK